MIDTLIHMIGYTVVVGFLAIFLRLLFADGDLLVIHHSLRKEYFRDRVVWITGASSGSKLGTKSDLGGNYHEAVQEGAKLCVKLTPSCIAIVD